jgi:hypothetical protein
MELLIVLFAVYFVLLLLIWDVCRPELKKIAKPRRFTFQQYGRDMMADVLVYTVSVGSVVDADVVERRLALVVDGGEPVVSVFPPEATELGEVRVPQGSTAILTLVDVDDAGNVSEPATLDFVATDTLPPAKPGELGVTLVKEEAAE